MVADTFKWVCRACGQTAAILNYQVKTTRWPIDDPRLDWKEVRVVEGRAIVCPNPDCHKLNLEVKLSVGYRSGTAVNTGNEIRTLLVEPRRHLPALVGLPESVRVDFEDACSIVGESPRAAATLARRALQGMIRDYWGIVRRTLKDEIDELAPKVDQGTWKAIDSIRRLGNIGAHMGADVNAITDVEAGEAERLLWLVEELVRDWYVRRHEKDQRLQELTRIADSKKTAVKSK